MSRAGQRIFLFFLSVFFFSLSFPGVGFSASVPDPVGDIYVQDFAHLLSPDQKNDLIRLGRSLEDETKAQVAVLTVESLDGKTIEEYALEAFRKYQLGDQQLNNGVLLVIATGDRKVRIEVGYGLEGALPDGKVGRILDEVTLPALKEGKTDKAIVDTYRLLVQEVGKEYGAKLQIPKGDSSDQPISLHQAWWVALIVILIFMDLIFFHGRLTYFIFAILSIFGRGKGSGGGGFGGGFGGGRGGGGGSSGGGGASRGW